MRELDHGWKPSMEEAFKNSNTDENKKLDIYAIRCGLLQHCVESQLFTNTVMNL
jgi:hypothetical protein